MNEATNVWQDPVKELPPSKSTNKTLFITSMTRTRFWLTVRRKPLIELKIQVNCLFMRIILFLNGFSENFYSLETATIDPPNPLE
jgi:hypothetical protein